MMFISRINHFWVWVTFLSKPTFHYKQKLFIYHYQCWKLLPVLEMLFVKKCLSNFNYLRWYIFRHQLLHCLWCVRESHSRRSAIDHLRLFFHSLHAGVINVDRCRSTRYGRQLSLFDEEPKFQILRPFLIETSGLFAFINQLYASHLQHSFL